LSRWQRVAQGGTYCAEGITTNADDAGATEIEITLDVRALPKQGTPYDLLLEPSLLIRNNAMFKSRGVGAQKQRRL
jgi:hypothetical protein